MYRQHLAISIPNKIVTSKAEKINELKNELKHINDILYNEKTYNKELIKVIETLNRSIKSSKRNIIWEIKNFHFENNEYISSPFSFYDRIWTLVFAINDSNGYGFLLNLHPLTSNTLNHINSINDSKNNNEIIGIDCKFSILHNFLDSYVRFREKPIHFDDNLNSRGFYDFISMKRLNDYILKDGSLRLNVCMEIAVIEETSQVLLNSNQW